MTIADLLDAIRMLEPQLRAGDFVLQCRADAPPHSMAARSFAELMAFSVAESITPDQPSDRTMYVRIERTGEAYTVEFSLDGISGLRFPVPR